MKKCPKCGCKTNSKSECPICYNTLTYEPIILDDDDEKLVFSKYLLLFFLKKYCFWLVCAIVCLVRFIMADEILWQYGALIIVLLVCSLILSAFSSWESRNIENKDFISHQFLTPQNALFRNDFFKYIVGGAAVFFSFIVL
ncbi:MAG: hypothetical protein KBS52_04900 [Clostridiales bacterium]|nr:hypothetical protein [Candidatus Equinaster intestinalis]